MAESRYGADGANALACIPQGKEGYSLMEWWQTLLMTGGTCLVTLIVTFAFNWITNGPKRLRERRRAELEELKSELKKSVEEVRDEANKQSDQCKNDHLCLARIVGDIQNTNKAQSEGLVAVLRDLLKIRYLEWLRKGYAPLDSRDDLEHMYIAYHGLGGNSTITELRARFLKLPVEKPKGKRRD